MANIPMMIKFLFLLVAAAAFFVGCKRERIGINNEYILPERLASYHVRTPDPRQKCPPVGQRLNVYWSLNQEIKHYHHLLLELRIIFRDHQQKTLVTPIKRPCGYYFFDLLNEDYFAKQGILTYKLTLFGDGEVIDEWRHQLWTELILFEKDPP